MPVTISSTTAPQSLNVLTTMAINIYAKRSRAQWRLQFAKLIDGNGKNDDVCFKDARLVLKYRVA
jgi:hypothetical protein